jgi:hypothetical protein
MRISPLQIIIGKGRRGGVVLDKSALEKSIVAHLKIFKKISDELNFVSKEGAIDKQYLTQKDVISKVLPISERKWLELRKHLLGFTIVNNKKDSITTEKDKNSQREMQYYFVENLPPLLKNVESVKEILYQDIYVLVVHDWESKIWKEKEEKYWDKIIADISSYGIRDETEIMKVINDQFEELEKEIDRFHSDKKTKFEELEKKKNKYLEKLADKLKLVKNKKDLKDKLNALIDEYGKLIPGGVPAMRTKIEAESGGGQHWGDANRGGVDGSWEKYLDSVEKIKEDTSGDYNALEYAEMTIAFGIVEAILISLINSVDKVLSPRPTRTQLEALITKCETDFKKGTNALFTSKDAATKIQNINTKFADKTVTEIIRNELEYSSPKKGKWREMLEEIDKYCRSTRSLADLSGEADRLEGEYGNPMGEINGFTNGLEPVKNSDLRNIAKANQANSDSIMNTIGANLTDETKANKYNKQWLWTEFLGINNGSPGNCFLASIAILLTGKSYDDPSGVIPKMELSLRTACCLYLMRHGNQFFGHNDEDAVVAQKIRDKLTTGKTSEDAAIRNDEADAYGRVEPWTRPGKYYANDDIRFFSPLLKRRIRCIYFWGSTKMGKDKKEKGIMPFEQTDPYDTYPDEPLTIHRVNGEHFVSLVPTAANRQGFFTFAPNKITVKEETGNPYIVFEVKKGGFQRKDDKKVGMHWNYEQTEKWLKEKNPEIKDQTHLIIYGNGSPKGYYDEWAHTFRSSNYAHRKIRLELYKTFWGDSHASVDASEKNISFRVEGESEIHMNWETVENIMFLADAREKFASLGSLPLGTEVEYYKEDDAINLFGQISVCGLRYPRKHPEGKKIMPKGSALAVETKKDDALRTSGIKLIINAISEGQVYSWEKEGEGETRVKKAKFENASASGVMSSIQNCMLVLAAGGSYDTIAMPLIGGGIFWENIENDFDKNKEELAKKIILTSIYQNQLMEKEYGHQVEIVFVDFESKVGAVKSQTTGKEFENALKHIKIKKNTYLVTDDDLDKIEVVKGDIADFAVHKSPVIINAANATCKVRGMGGTAGAIDVKLGDADAAELDQKAEEIIDQYFKNVEIIVGKKFPDDKYMI